MKAEMKGHMINLGITIVGTVIGAYIVQKLLIGSEQKALATAQKTTTQPPRKVEITTLVPEDQTAAV